MTNELKSVIRQYCKLEKAWLSPVKNTDEYLAATCLFEYPSYRLLDSDRTDPLLGFRVLLRTLRRIFKQDIGLKKIDTKGDSIVVSGTIAIQDRVTEYVRRSGNSNLHSYLAKDILNIKTSQKLQLLFVLLPFALRQSLKCIFSRYRQGIALSIAEVTEIAYVLNYIKTNNIKTVYDFVPYEVDSNFMYLTMREHQVHVVKIPSSGPLATHHRILLADEVVFSTPYHQEEQMKFRETFRVKNYLMWPPERAFQYFPRYKQEKPKAKSKTLGFYSHGEWLRKEEKHSAYGGRIGEAESTILKYLGQYVKANPDFELIIFPHPREMRPDVSERMNSFYKKTIGHDQFQIATFSGGTTQNFEKADIAIAAFSTILYERLFCGYKTLIGNMAITEFPMNRSHLNRICFRTYEAMAEMITDFSSHNEDYYFQQSMLTGYRADQYPEP
jgi:hypothetical protein